VTATEFFKPDVTYLQNEPFRAPELLVVFKCVAVTANPGTGERWALGFVTYAHPGDEWELYAEPAAGWAEGWVPAAFVDGQWMPRSGSWDPKASETIGATSLAAASEEADR
jgi:hypothetical protein